MIIKGFQKLTLVDYPKKLAALIFLPFCNFKCGYCYNTPLWEDDFSIPDITEEEVLEFMKSRVDKLDALAITGGEPLLHKDLPEFVRKVKDLGFLVKIDTNGTNPVMLKKLIDERLVDYVAMDVKAPLYKYEKVVGVKADTEAIQKSIQILKESSIDYEFRTTVLPCLQSKADLLEIAGLLKGSKKLALQQFTAFEGVKDKKLCNEEKYNKDDLEEIKKEVEPFFDEVVIRI